MRFIVFLVLVWLVLYVTLYAAFGFRLARWFVQPGMARRDTAWRPSAKVGQSVNAVVGLAALGGAWTVLGLVASAQQGVAASPGTVLPGPVDATGAAGSFISPSIVYFGLGQLATFAMSILASLVGNMLHARWLS